MNWIDEAITKAGGRAALARLLGVSNQAVTFWADGVRTPDPETCSTLDVALGVRRWRIRPHDWHRIWPELINAKGAPKVPEQAAAG